MTKVVMRKNLSSLVPADEQAVDMLAKIKHGDLVFVEVKRGRNVAHHRKLFALLQIVFENQDHYKSVDDILTAFKLRTGHYKVKRFILDGVPFDYYEPKSISFAALSQEAFEPVYTKMVDFLVSEVIPGLGREELERQVMEVL